MVLNLLKGSSSYDSVSEIFIYKFEKATGISAPNVLEKDRYN